jgi:hypothetical protein
MRRCVSVEELQKGGNKAPLVLWRLEPDKENRTSEEGREKGSEEPNGSTGSLQEENASDEVSETTTPRNTSLTSVPAAPFELRYLPVDIALHRTLIDGAIGRSAARGHLQSVQKFVARAAQQSAGRCGEHKKEQRQEQEQAREQEERPAKAGRRKRRSRGAHLKDEE